MAVISDQPLPDFISPDQAEAVIAYSPEFLKAHRGLKVRVGMLPGPAEEFIAAGATHLAGSEAALRTIFP